MKKPEKEKMNKKENFSESRYANRAEQIKLMEASALFAGFGAEDCETAHRLLKPTYKTVLKGEALIHEGVRVDFVGLICEGKMVSMKVDEEGNSSLQDILEPKYIFGLDVAATPSRISPTILISVENSSVLLFSYSQLFIDDTLPESHRIRLMHNIIPILANKNMSMMYKTEILCEKALRKKIILYLKLVANKEGTMSFTIPFNRDQLAQYLNVNRSALSNELSRMQKEGLLGFRKNRFTLNWDIKK